MKVTAGSRKRSSFIRARRKTALSTVLWLGPPWSPGLTTPSSLRDFFRSVDICLLLTPLRGGYEEYEPSIVVWRERLYEEYETLIVGWREEREVVDDTLTAFAPLFRFPPISLSLSRVKGARRKTIWNSRKRATPRLP